MQIEEALYFPERCSTPFQSDYRRESELWSSNKTMFLGHLV